MLIKWKTRSISFSSNIGSKHFVSEKFPEYTFSIQLKFNLKGQDFKLTIYQSQEDLNDEKYKDYLFIPFTDNTSGEDSYGGGRYMDVMLTDIKTDNDASPEYPDLSPTKTDRQATGTLLANSR